MTPARDRPDLAGYLFVCEVELLDHLLVCARLVKGVEVFPMQLLHQSFFEAHGIVSLTWTSAGIVWQSGAPGGTKTTFSCDQLVFIRADLSHEDWLKDAHRLDRINKRGQAPARRTGYEAG